MNFQLIMYINNEFIKKIKSNKNKYLITTPIFYPNDKPHLGSAHTMVIADFINRALNQLQLDSVMLTGLDEHGDKVYNSVKKTYGEENIYENINYIVCF